MIKLLIGGSPCTHWSIAQSKNRETKAEGIGWELFENYVIAKEKFKPDFFLYENNWSASKEIKDQIQEELGHELMRINSRLVSAQNRDRFYVFNWKVEQPEDRGILLKDILEGGEPFTNEKSYCVTATEYKGSNPKQTMEKHRRTMIAEPVRVGTYPTECGQLKGSQGQRIYGINGKSVTQSANGGGKDGIRNMIGNNVDRRTCVAKPCTYTIPNECDLIVSKNAIRCQRRDAKHSSVQGTHVNFEYGKSQTVSVSHTPKVITASNQPIYEVKNGVITIKDKMYPIKLKDGYYIIRKLTPVECERLQTLPDEYTAAVSDTQRYKGLGNGWTAEVIIHILNGVLKDVSKDEKIVVLSMYDGIATGRYCLDKMGFTNVKYHAYEIDKYAIKVAVSNYPDIIQHGDAFQVRNSDWRI